MELSNTVHRLNDFYEEFESAGCTEMILIGVKWKEDGDRDVERISVHRNSSNADTTIIPIALTLAMAAKEMGAKKILEVQSPFGKVIVVTEEDSAPIYYEEEEE